MYAEQWDDYRKRCLMFWSIWLGGFLGVAAVCSLLNLVMRGGIVDIVSLVIAGAWMLAFAVASIRLTYWRCPRCHHYYFVGTLMVNQLARRCLHCGLQKWDEDEG